MNKLKTAVIQLDIVWMDIEQNLINTENALKRLPEGCDVVILPEMFTTGFIVDRQTAMSIGGTDSGRTIAKMTELAHLHNTAICGSFICRNGDSLYNRAFFIEPSGDKVFYNKRHLFTMGGENLTYTPGEDPMPVFRYRGWNIAMAVCFDLRFPAWLRNVDASYDLLIVMANWPDSRAYAWQMLLIARAIENQAYVVGCNRSGTDDFGSYSYKSLIVEPKGRVIAGHTEFDAEPETSDIIVTDLSKDSLERFRQKFPVCQSMDHFKIL